MRSSLHTDFLFYAHESLDRAHLLRSDTQKIELFLSHTETRFIPHWRDQSIFKQNGGSVEPLSLNSDFIASVQDAHLFFVGLFKDQPVFGIDLSHLERNQVSQLLEEGAVENLRKHAATLNNDEASLLAYVRGMFTWHNNHKYCGKCGSETISASSGHERKCTNPDCKSVLFPRIDPAVIVLIHHQFEDGINRCLLGRHKRSAKGMYSTLAGFVEPGESLEMTVKREMFEESGLLVDNVQYIASQPWPFPSSIMLGFFAEAKTTTLNLEEDELAEAHWFTAKELLSLSEAGEIKLSGNDSIANYLIRQWMKEEGVG